MLATTLFLGNTSDQRERTITVGALRFAGVKLGIRDSNLRAIKRGGFELGGKARETFLKSTADRLQ